MEVISNSPDTIPLDELVIVKCQGWPSFEILAKNDSEMGWLTPVDDTVWPWRQLRLKVIGWRYRIEPMSLEQIHDKLIELRLGCVKIFVSSEDKGFFFSEDVMIGDRQNDSFILWARHKTQSTRDRITKILQDAFKDVPNVTVDPKGIGEIVAA